LVICRKVIFYPLIQGFTCSTSAVNEQAQASRGLWAQMWRSIDAGWCACHEEVKVEGGMSCCRPSDLLQICSAASVPGLLSEVYVLSYFLSFDPPRQAGSHLSQG